MNTAPHRENIVLIGFMGCGKSTVGRELHQRLGYPLADMDQIIEARAGMSISEIFASPGGETSFRDMESALLKEFAEDGISGRIISTGGGVIGREKNREIIRVLGYVVWLDAPAKVIVERTRRTKIRPLLLTEDPEERIRTLLTERMPLYQEVAHMRLDTSGLDSSELATGILESARYHFSKQP